MPFACVRSFTLLSIQGVFMELAFSRLPTLIPPLYHIFYIVFYIGSPLFFQFSVTGAGAGVGAGFFFSSGRRGLWLACK